LDSGTLLGAIRDKRLIPWDNDIDIGLWHRDISQVYEIIKEMKQINCELRYKYGPMSEFGEINLSNIGPIRGIFIKKNDIALGIEPYVLINNEAKRTFLIERRSPFTKIIQRLVNLITKSQQQQDIKKKYSLKAKAFLKFLNLLPSDCVLIIKRILLHFFENGKVSNRYIPAGIPAHYFEKFSKIKFYDMEFRIPEDYEGYLSFRYGDQWAIPQKNWIHYVNDGSSSINK